MVGQPLTELARNLWEAVPEHGPEPRLRRARWDGPVKIWQETAPRFHSLIHSLLLYTLLTTDY